MRNSLLQIRVGFVGHIYACHGVCELVDDLRSVAEPELLGHEEPSDGEVRLNRIEHIKNPGDVVHQGKINGLDLRPERETSVCDDQRIRVPRPC